MITSRLALAAITGGALQVSRSAPFEFPARNPIPGGHGTIFTRLAVLAAVVTGLFAHSLSLAAPAVSLQWDPNPETNIASYEVSYGTSAGNYTTVVNVGQRTTASVTGLTGGQTYYFALAAYNLEGQKSPVSAEISYQVAATPPDYVPQSGWTLLFVDSEETPDFPATAAFDGNPATIWHTRWTSNVTAPPHDLQINMGIARNLNGFRYLPRQDLYTVGNIGQYEFYVSMDGINWGTPVASGTFASGSTEKEILFSAKRGQFIRLRALSENSGGNFTSVAELRVLEQQGNIAGQAPLAIAQSASTAEDTPLPVTLSASDANGDVLTYAIVTSPTKGTLSGTPPNLTYTPQADYNGTDSFTFKANDGSLDSATATIVITVTAVNDAPVASAKSLSTAEDTPAPVVLTGTDKEANPLTFAVVTLPTKGTLSGTPPNLTYTPQAHYSGSDSFTFRTHDGTAFSSVATVSITIIPVNDAPTATAQTLSTREDTELPIVLSGSDLENATLSFSIVTTPTHGEILGTPPNLTYIPAADFHGSDQFTFKTNDGTSDSATATIAITVTPVDEVPGNIAPVFGSNTILAAATEDTDFSGQLAATDANPGDTLIYSKISGPAWLTVSRTGALGGTPLNGNVGLDTFTVKVTDPSNASADAVLKITVANTNDAPSFQLNTTHFPSASEGEAYIGQTLAGAATDPDSGDTLTYSKTSGPSWLVVSSAGTLGGTPPTGSKGLHQFTIRATDTNGASADTTLQIQILENSLPLPWSVDRLGSENLLGGARYASGRFTLSGSGALSKTADAGNFGWQTLTDDGEISARVVNTDDSSKAPLVGLMIRASLATNSRQVFFGADKEGDYSWLRRANTGGSTAKTTSKNANPSKIWLRLVRKGDTITAYKSNDGDTWKNVGDPVKISLPKNCYVGLAVSSGNNSQLSTSTFSNVRVTR